MTTETVIKIKESERVVISNLMDALDNLPITLSRENYAEYFACIASKYSGVGSSDIKFEYIEGE